MLVAEVCASASDFPLRLPKNLYNRGRVRLYVHDMRRALIAAYENHDYSQRAVAALLGVRPATVQHIVRRQRETETPVARVNSLRRFHNPLAHIGTRSNAITSKSAGR